MQDVTFYYFTIALSLFLQWCLGLVIKNPLFLEFQYIHPTDIHVFLFDVSVFFLVRLKFNLLHLRGYNLSLYDDSPRGLEAKNQQRVYANEYLGSLLVLVVITSWMWGSVPSVLVKFL